MSTPPVPLDPCESENPEMVSVEPLTVKGSVVLGRPRTVRVTLFPLTTYVPALLPWMAKVPSDLNSQTGQLVEQVSVRLSEGLSQDEKTADVSSRNP